MKIKIVLLILLFVFLPIKPASTSNETQTCKVLPLLIEFPDALHKRTAEDMYQAFFSDKTFEQDNKNFISVRNFFKETTNNKYDFVPGSYGVGKWLKLSKKKTEYHGTVDGTNDLHELVHDVFTMLEKQNIDLSEYDQDEDGYFDYIVFICSGDPKEETFFWWHSGWMFDAKYKGIEVGRYNINGESRKGENNLPLQTICHEFYHYLGGFDLYSYDPQCKIDPVGPWDIMGSNYKFKSFGLSSFSRAQLGWLDEEVITQPGTYEISALCTQNPKRLYRIDIPDTEEYFLIENRFVTGTDSWWQGIPNKGLVIYHVDGSILPAYRFNDGPPKYEHFAVWVENPGTTNTFCQENRLTEFTSLTNPNSRDYKDKSSSEILITNISKFGLTMSFKVEFVKKTSASPILNVEPIEINFGTIEQKSNSLQKIHIKNIGTGELECKITKTTPLILIDKTSTKENNAEVNVRIDTANITAKQNGSIRIESNGGSVTIKVTFEIVKELGDLNADGQINKYDFFILQESFGLHTGEEKFNPKADLLQDGKIDINDVIILAKHVIF
jgi:M6 family metalloprotease-like protein